MDIVGIAEIAKRTGLSRQGITNLRKRSMDFPAPIAELAAGPVFNAAEVEAFFKQRGTRMTSVDYTKAVARNELRFDPLDRASLGLSVARALLEEPENPLPPAAPFAGAGLYLLHYNGAHPAYRPISGKKVPIYCGRAIPPGGRKGVAALFGNTSHPAIYNRLREHAKSLESVQIKSENEGTTGLRVNDFTCRFLVVDDIWVPLAEQLILAHFQPVWNMVVDGFGNHDPGAGRRAGARSDWDQLHPGRPWAELQALPGRDPQETLQRIEEHLVRLPTPELTRPILDQEAAATS